MPQTNDDRRSLLLPVVFGGLLLLGYLLSYAPVYRLGKNWGWSSTTRQHALYQPIDWLIDNTPLDEPLYRWADCWSVRADFVWAAAWRAFHRGEASAIIATEAETPHLYEHVIDESAAAE